VVGRVGRRGGGRDRIDSRHFIWSLVRKPGAFANYRYRDELFPSLLFRQAYDTLQAHQPRRADAEYVRLLHLAGTSSEADVEAAISLLLYGQQAPTFEATRALLRPPSLPAAPLLSCPTL